MPSELVIQFNKGTVKRVVTLMLGTMGRGLEETFVLR